MSHSFPSETCTPPLFPPLSFHLKNIELSYHYIPMSFSLYLTWFPKLFMDLHVFALLFCAVSSAQNFTFINPTYLYSLFPSGNQSKDSASWYPSLQFYIEIISSSFEFCRTTLVSLNTLNIFLLYLIVYYVYLLSPLL